MKFGRAPTTKHTGIVTRQGCPKLPTDLTPSRTMSVLGLPGHSVESFRHRVILLEICFWAALALLAWTHLLYPLAARLVAGVRSVPVRKDDAHVPRVTVVVAAHNEEAVIGRRVENLQALDYPADRLQLVVTSDLIGRAQQGR